MIANVIIDYHVDAPDWWLFAIFGFIIIMLLLVIALSAYESRKR